MTPCTIISKTEEEKITIRNFNDYREQKLEALDFRTFEQDSFLERDMRETR